MTVYSQTVYNSPADANKLSADIIPIAIGGQTMNRITIYCKNVHGNVTSFKVDSAVTVHYFFSSDDNSTVPRSFILPMKTESISDTTYIFRFAQDFVITNYNFEYR